MSRDKRNQRHHTAQSERTEMAESLDAHHPNAPTEVVGISSASLPLDAQGGHPDGHPVAARSADASNHGYAFIPNSPPEASLLTRQIQLSQALTTAALEHLELDSLLPALLGPIKEMMRVDNVAILLTTRDGKSLLVRAAHGLEEESVGRVRVPFGKGFAGRIAASRHTLVVPDLKSFDAINPILRERVRSIAGVPLLVGEQFLGVLHIGTASLHTFSPEDIEMLQRVAENVALAIDRARLYRAERDARKAAEQQEHRIRTALEALLELAAAMVSPAIDNADNGETANPQEDPVDALAALCCRVLACDRLAIIGAERETEILHPIVISGSPTKQEKAFRASFADQRLAERFGADIVAQLHAGEPALIDIGRLGPNDPAHILSQHYFLIAPMFGEGRLMGYVGVNFGDEEQDYTPENIALTQATAQLIGMVIEREKLAHEREEAQARARAWEHAKRQMDEFLSIAGHEMRTPITSAQTNVQMVTRILGNFLQAEQAVPEGAYDEPAGHTAGESSDHLKRLERAYDLLLRTRRQFARQERLINDLLDVSRIDAGKLELRLDNFDLVALVQDCAAEQQAIHPNRMIRVMLPEKPLMVHADVDRLAQVISNLLSNALKYSEIETPVIARVEPAADGSFARCEIIDEGPGLNAEEQERIWQRFYRVAGLEPESGSGIGLGLGLYITKTIIEQHGGQIGVESAPGMGSTFWFSLPLATPTHD